MDNDVVGGYGRPIDGDGGVSVGLGDEESPRARLVQDFIGLYSFCCRGTINS